jgi:hypothetical protein
LTLRGHFGRVAVRAGILVVARRNGPSVFSIHLRRDLAARLSSTIRKRINYISLKFLLDSTTASDMLGALLEESFYKKIDAL